MASSCSNYFHSHRPKGRPMSLCCIHQSAQIACKHTVMHLLSNTKKKQLGTKSPCQFLCTNSVQRRKQTAAVLMSTFGSVPTEMNFGQEQRRRWWPVCGHPSWRLTTHLCRNHHAQSHFIIRRRPDCLGFWQNGPKEESTTLRCTFSWLQRRAETDAQWMDGVSQSWQLLQPNTKTIHIHIIIKVVDSAWSCLVTENSC